MHPTKIEQIRQDVQELGFTLANSDWVDDGVPISCESYREHDMAFPGYTDTMTLHPDISRLAEHHGCIVDWVNPAVIVLFEA